MHTLSTHELVFHRRASHCALNLPEFGGLKAGDVITWSCHIRAHVALEPPQEATTVGASLTYIS